MAVSTVAATPVAKGLAPEVQRAVGRVTEIGSLPEITTRILEVVENPRATARQVHDVVRADPALAAKILKIITSSFYGLPAQISNLERAIVMLGLAALKNLALATSLLKLIKTAELGPGFTTRDLWRHCVAVAVAGRQIALTGHAVQPDEAFVAGLMHDLGLIIEQQLFPQKLADVVARCAAERQSFCACESAIIGADHSAIGVTLATKWKFPLTLRNVIGYHHEPMSLQPEHQKLATVVYVADTLACTAQYGLWLTAANQTPSEALVAMLNMPAEELERVRSELPARLGEAEEIFGAPQGA